MKAAALAIALLACSAPALAQQVYSCPDGRGGKTYQQTPCGGAGDTGYVRCVKSNGESYVYRGSSCPVRRESVEHRSGMVTDVTTGQQTFMVPGGGNGMIAPRTGQRHELLSPPPTRQVRDAGQSISREDACRQEKARLDQALSDFDRTMKSIRAAEDRYQRICG